MRIRWGVDMPSKYCELPGWSTEPIHTQLPRVGLLLAHWLKSSPAKRRPAVRIQPATTRRHARSTYAARAIRNLILLLLGFQRRIETTEGSAQPTMRGSPQFRREAP